MKKILLTTITLLLILGLFACTNSKDNNHIEQEETKVDLPSLINYKDLENHLMFNDNYNLLFDSYEIVDDKRIICKYHSFVPTSINMCLDYLVTIDCIYDDVTNSLKYGEIVRNQLGTVKQPTKRLYLPVRSIGNTYIDVPFSWDRIESYEGYYLQIGFGDEEIGYNKNIEDFLEHDFNFRNEQTLVLNGGWYSSVAPYLPIEKSNEYYDYYINDETGVGVLTNNVVGTVFRINTSLPFDERIELINSIKPTIDTNDINTTLNDSYIDYGNALFHIKLLYKMRIRSNRSQGDNILRLAQEKEVFPVYKIVDDGQFIWYCIGNHQWIGDDGTCLEKYK